MKRLLLVSLGLLVALAVACGGDGSSSSPTDVPTRPAPTPEPTVDRSQDLPPPLTVTSGAASTEAGLGTFCWRGLCVDMAGPVTPPDAIEAQGTSLTATIARETAAEANVSAQLAGGANPPVSQEADRGMLAWSGGDPAVDLPFEVAGDTITADISSLTTGRYIISVFVSFEAGGDAAYGILLDVP